MTDAGIREILLPSGRHFVFLGPTSGYFSMNLKALMLYWVPFEDPDGSGELLGALRSAFTFASTPDGMLAVFGSGTPQEDAVVLDVVDRRKGSLSRTRIDLETIMPNVGVAEVDGVLSLSFSPDASRLIAATLGGSAAVFDTDSWERLQTFSEGGGQVTMAAYRPDASLIVTMSQDGEILFRDPDTLQPTGSPLLGQTDGIQGFSHGPSFTADGRHMFTTEDGDGRIWDMERRVSVGQAFPNSNFSAGLSADGRRMGTSDGERVIIWNTELSSWAAIACEAAGRNLTVEEWQQFGPNDTQYEKTCDQWP
jgi:WD40 repeat protein